MVSVVSRVANPLSDGDVCFVSMLLDDGAVGQAVEDDAVRLQQPDVVRALAASSVHGTLPFSGEGGGYVWFIAVVDFTWV